MGWSRLHVAWSFIWWNQNSQIPNMHLPMGNSCPCLSQLCVWVALKLTVCMDDSVAICDAIAMFGGSIYTNAHITSVHNGAVDLQQNLCIWPLSRHQDIWLSCTCTLSRVKFFVSDLPEISANVPVIVKCEANLSSDCFCDFQNWIPPWNPSGVKSDFCPTQPQMQMRMVPHFVCGCALS